jgi:predicted amidohydrolase YtcJ
LEELAMLKVMTKMPTPTPEKAMEMMEQGMRFYAKAGITTAQDCASGKGTLKLLKAMEQQGKLPIDIIAWPIYKGVDDENSRPSCRTPKSGDGCGAAA